MEYIIRVTGTNPDVKMASINAITILEKFQKAMGSEAIFDMEYVRFRREYTDGSALEIEVMANRRYSQATPSIGTAKPRT